MAIGHWGGRMMLAAALACAAGTALTQPLAVPCDAADKDCLRQAIRSHVVRQPDFWRADLARPLADRVGSASPELLQYLALDNMKEGYPERPRAPGQDEAFLSDVRAAFAELPPPVQRLFDRRLIGIFLVDELGGTGWTDMVRDTSGKPVGAMIVLDAAVLKKYTANEWATWKENTPFKPDPRWQLQARIEDAGHDSRRYAIQYILLHELGHVLAIGSDVHPSHLIEPKEVPEGERFPFFELSWRADQRRNRYFSLFDLTLGKRDDVGYYFGARLTAGEMLPLYTALAQTNFATLYAVTSPFDDFAETFASYVHTMLLGRPWQITISRDGESVKVFKSCWEEQRCAAKRELLEQILASP